MGHVNSPCINICKLDENKICIGCYRTLDEIANWTKYTDKEKQNIINQVQNRIQGESNV
jgi:predicted Fe-S protein YdhL (DUF1289 family)